MAHILLTGVTGLVGRYLVKDLLEAGLPLAVLVRPTRRATARQRVDTMMAEWEQKLGRSLPRPVALEGDITEPDLGLSPRAMRWVAENCDALLHNAASLTFESTGKDAEPWRSNVTGTRNVLEVCRNARIRKFHHVSTAYVCGRREGRVLETELDVGQALSNDYEQSKVEAEKLVRSSAFIDELTVYRPAIIIGDSVTGFTTTYHGFYAPLQLVHTIVQRLQPDETGRAHSRARFALDGHETKNLVPVDWVSAVTAHIVTHPEHHGKTYHLTPRHPAPIRLLGDVLEQATGFYAVSFQGVGNPVEDYTEYEQLFHDMIKIYNSYWRNDPTFDTTNTLAAAPHLPCPHVDRELLMKLAECAIAVNFEGPRAKPIVPDFDAQRALESLTEASDSPDGRAAGGVRLGLDITGPGGGQWSLHVRDGGVVTADVGVDAREMPTLHLSTAAFATLVRGEQTANHLLADRTVRFTGGDLPEPQLAGVLQDLAEACQSRAVLSR